MTDASRNTLPTVYQIRVKGHLDYRWTDRFEGLAITLEEGGVTRRTTGSVADQPALHAILRARSDGRRYAASPLRSSHLLNPNHSSIR